MWLVFIVLVLATANYTNWAIAIGVAVLSFIIYFKLARKTPVKQAIHTKAAIPEHIKQEVVRIQNGKCAICTSQDQGLHIFHHKIKRSRGGSNTVENILFLCPECHALVHAKEEGKNLKVNYRK